MYTYIYIVYYCVQVGCQQPYRSQSLQWSWQSRWARVLVIQNWSQWMTLWTQLLKCKRGSTGSPTIECLRVTRHDSLMHDCRTSRGYFVGSVHMTGSHNLLHGTNAISVHVKCGPWARPSGRSKALSSIAKCVLMIVKPISLLNQKKMWQIIERIPGRAAVQNHTKACTIDSSL